MLINRTGFSIAIHHGNFNYRPTISNSQTRCGENDSGKRIHDCRSRSVTRMKMRFFANRLQKRGRPRFLRIRFVRIEGGVRVGKARHQNITRYSTRIDITERLITSLIACSTNGCSRIAFLPTALLCRVHQRG